MLRKRERMHQYPRLVLFLFFFAAEILDKCNYDSDYDNNNDDDDADNNNDDDDADNNNVNDDDNDNSNDDDSDDNDDDNDDEEEKSFHGSEQKTFEIDSSSKLGLPSFSTKKWWMVKQLVNNF